MQACDQLLISLMKYIQPLESGNYTDRHERRPVARRERQRTNSKWQKLTGSHGHVTVDAQNCPKLGGLRVHRLLFN